MPRLPSTANSSGPKSSPTGPTTRTSVKKLAASEKCTAEPPSMRSRSPNGVRTESKAIDPTTVRDMRRLRILASPPHQAPGEPGRANCLHVKAVQMSEFGGPEVLEHTELPDPDPGDGEIVVAVARSGVNFADTHVTRNDYLAEQQLPMIPGGEISGTTPDGRRVAALLMNG